MSDLERLKERLRDCPPGLALDIDDTLSLTKAYWGKEMFRLFGNPEHLTWQELCAKYRRYDFVPYWQTAEAMQWMDSHRRGGAYLEELEHMEGSHESLARIQEHVPIHLYLTVRSVEALDVTKRWLVKHGYPDAEIIARPLDVPYEDSYAWKASVLMELYPAVVGMIDDDASLPASLPSDYAGTVYLIGREKHADDNVRLHQCPTWEDVSHAIKRTHPPRA